VTHFEYPPWKAAADEASVTDNATFIRCDQAINAFASQGNGKILGQTYSISKKWGRVVRARVGFSHAGSTGAALVTCWSGAGPGVQMAVEIEDCASQSAGC
jgi:hypothetical protein